jgi:hypothetical protein
MIPTLHAPLCVAATAPETVVEPVTGTGMGDTMATFDTLPWSWADACREFMIDPITASKLNTAAAIRWFLYRFIFALLGQKQWQITWKNLPRS